MNKKMLLIVGAAVLLVGGGGAAYYFLMAAPEEAAAAAEPEPVKAGLVELEPFLTNIADPSGDRHARVQVKLAVAPETKAAEIKADELLVARLRDQVLTRLSAKTFAEVSSAEGRQAFREELKSALQPLIADADLEEVLFSDFVVQ